MNGARILVEELIHQGVRVVFGYPGGAVLDIYNELYLASDRIGHVLAAHEQDVYKRQEVIPIIERPIAASTRFESSRTSFWAPAATTPPPA